MKRITNNIYSNSSIYFIGLVDGKP